MSGRWDEMARDKEDAYQAHLRSLMRGNYRDRLDRVLYHDIVVDKIAPKASWWRRAIQWWRD